MCGKDRAWLRTNGMVENTIAIPTSEGYEGYLDGPYTTSQDGK